MMQGASTHLVGRSLMGLGIVLMAANGYLQPLVFHRPLSELFSASQEAAIGSPGVRTVLPLAALGCMVLGLLFKYVLVA
jgi:hypothetical protein